MEEEWRDIEGFKGLYQVSNLGRVKSLGRWVDRQKYRAFLNERVLTNKKHTGGYENVCLCKEGKNKYRFVHALVAEAFIPNPESKLEVNHIDGNKTNNKVSNLEWNTRIENHMHAIVNNLRKRDIYRVYDLCGNLLYPATFLANLIKMGYTQSGISRNVSGKLKHHKFSIFRKV